MEFTQLLAGDLNLSNYLLIYRYKYIYMCARARVCVHVYIVTLNMLMYAFFRVRFFIYMLQNFCVAYVLFM